MRVGLDVLQTQAWKPLRGLRVGLVCHPASVDQRLRHAADLLAAAPEVHLAALFGPEHGALGQAQDLIGVTDQHDAASGLRIYSLYGGSFDSLRPTAEQLRNLDALVIDLQDVGSRYYTFQATMLLCLEAASAHGLKTVVLDRPNPLGGDAVEGPDLRPGFESFVGLHPLATRHGMTIGELARLYQAERRLTGALEIIPCDGWRRGMDFEQTGLPWVLPSPNMPTIETALVYPGQCLLEGTNLSEGRGTTRPFELCGAPGSMHAAWQNGWNAKDFPAFASDQLGSSRRFRSSPTRPAAAFNSTSSTGRFIVQCGQVWRCWLPCANYRAITSPGAPSRMNS